MSEASAEVRAGTTGGGASPVSVEDTGQPLFAAAWMLLALLSFSAMAVGGRELVGHLDTFSIMFYRSLIGLAVVVSVLAVTGRFQQVKTRRIGTHFWRNVAHFTGQNLWFYAVGYITLAQLFALEFTSPIWVALAAPFFLGERFTAWQVGTTIAGFIGVLIVVRPGVTEVGIGEMTVLASSVCFASNIMITKALSRTETTLSIVFWMTLMQAVMAGVILLGQPIVPDREVVLQVIVVGLGGLIAHFSLARAFRHADASVVAPMDFLRLPLIAFVGALAYAEALDPYVFIGGAIVFFSNYVNVWRSSRKAG